MELANREYPLKGSDHNLKVSLSQPYPYRTTWACDVFISDGQNMIERKGIGGADSMQAVKAALFIIQVELDKLKRDYGDKLELIDNKVRFRT